MGVKLQVVPLTVAVPRMAPPLNTRSVWVAVSAALRVPLKVGVVSSVVAPRAKGPVLAPTLSSTWVMLDVWLGANGLTVMLWLVLAVAPLSSVTVSVTV